MENERADAGWDSRTLLANSQARTGTTGKINFPCSVDHKQDWQPHPVDAQSTESIICGMKEPWPHELRSKPLTGRTAVDMLVGESEL